MKAKRKNVTLHLSSLHPLACAKLRSVSNRTEFIRGLIEDDISCPEILRAPLGPDDSKQDLSPYDSSPLVLTVAFNPDIDAHLIKKLEENYPAGRYIRDLIYYSIGEDPKEHTTTTAIPRRRTRTAQ